MKKILNKKKVFLAAAAAAFVSGSALANQGAMAGEFVVKLKPGAIHSLSANAALKSVEQVGPETFVVNGNESALLADPTVERVEPNYIYRALGALDWSLENHGQKDCGGNSGLPGFDVKARPAWNITKGSGEVIVAVIDTGVDVWNPRLREKIAVNQAEAEGQAGIDDDRNGYIDDAYGYNFISNAGVIGDNNGHGTFCAGAIASSSSDSDSVSGLAPGIKVLPVQFLDESGTGTLANAVKAIDYAVARGAKILSNSWGGGQHSEIMEEAIKRAQAKGVLFVAAAGNNGSNNDRFPVYPASYKLSNIIAVAAVDNRGKMPTFSNFGSSVHVAAPGVNLMGLSKDGKTECMSGTSMSTPLVAATAGLMLSKNPALSAEAMKERILETATPLSSLLGKTQSGKMVNAYGALLGL